MTRALWRGDMIESFAEPSAPNELTAFADPGKQDILVRYAELSPWRDSPRTRAYYVRRNADRVQEHRRPRFESAAAANQLVPLPLYRGATPWDVPSQVWVVASEKGNEFTIYRAGGAAEGPYALPVYRGKFGKVEQALMTPATVLVDASVVGSLLGYIYLNAKCGSSSLDFSWFPFCGW